MLTKPCCGEVGKQQSRAIIRTPVASVLIWGAVDDEDEDDAQMGAAEALLPACLLDCLTSLYRRPSNLHVASRQQRQSRKIVVHVKSPSCQLLYMIRGIKRRLRGWEVDGWVGVEWSVVTIRVVCGGALGGRKAL